MSTSKITPGIQFPNIILPLVGGGSQELGKVQKSGAWRLVITYRGKFCPLCTIYLNQLQKLHEDFLADGTEVIAVSGDSKEQAESYAEENNFSFPIAYELSLEQMKSLGLYISDPMSAKEGDRPFSEPGMFVVTPEGNVQTVYLSSSPFARPDLTLIKQSLDYIKQPPDKRYDSYGTTWYPIRGKHIS